jgi:hypothetical protein
MGKSVDNAHCIKKYTVLILIFFVSLTQSFKNEFRTAIGHKPSIAPLCLSELIAGTLALFFFYVIAETLFVNDIV